MHQTRFMLIDKKNYNITKGYLVVEIVRLLKAQLILFLTRTALIIVTDKKSINLESHMKTHLKLDQTKNKIT